MINHHGEEYDDGQNQKVEKPVIVNQSPNIKPCVNTNGTKSHMISRKAGKRKESAVVLL